MNRAASAWYGSQNASVIVKGIVDYTVEAGRQARICVKSIGSRVQVDPALKSKKMKKNIWRAVIEVSFIIFLFYANLLMGEFERSGMGEKKGLAWAMADVFTFLNFGIALIAALIGYVLFEFLRTRF
jgi:hypothetical protein